MRGIDRVLAVILLAGAVGGAAAFARHSGSDSTPRGVHLAAPPLQHVRAPGTVLIAPMPAAKRVSPPKAAPARRVTIPQATLRRPAKVVQPQNRPQPPEPKPAPAPVQAAPAPVQTPTPLRVLAAVQPASVPSDRKGKGRGHASGHGKHDDAVPAPQAPLAPTTDSTVVPLTPADSSGDEQGNGNGNDHGHGSGHDSGRDQGRPKHSGD